MHIEIDKPLFIKMLLHIQNVVEKKSTLPILGHVLLSADIESGEFSCCATDMDMELTVSAPIQVLKSGKACVNAQLLYDIVKKLNQKITLELTDATLCITSGRSRFDLLSIPFEDFPEISQTQISHHFEIPARVLFELIDTTKPFICDEEIRYNMSGILLHIAGDQKLRAVASDMHRLTVAECTAPQGCETIEPAIISRKTAQEVLKLLEDGEPLVSIGLSASRFEMNVIHNNHHARLASRLIDGVFPEYEEALNVADDKLMIVNTKAFADSVDRVGSVVNADKVRAARLSVTNDTATLSTVSKDTGSATEDVDVVFSSSESVEVCFNIRYVLDVAQKIKADEMEILLQGQDDSILLRPVGADVVRAVFIIMPMSF